MTATVLEDGKPGHVVIEAITGDGGRLSKSAMGNCAGIAAIETLKLLDGTPSCGVSLKVAKGLPLGSGMGSSAASAAAAAAACRGHGRGLGPCCDADCGCGCERPLWIYRRARRGV